MRGSLLLVGMVSAALYISLSFVFEARPSTLSMDLQSRSPSGSDSANGAVRWCTGCHALNRMENSVGPHLVGVVGRRAGVVLGFAYSDAMRHADLRWSRGQLRAFLLDPQSVVPGTAMPATLVDGTVADDIVDYLSQRH